MKQNRYSILDSSKALTFSLFSFLVVGLVISIIVFVASSFFNIPYGQVQNQEWVSYLNIFLSEGIYFCIYLLVVKLSKSRDDAFFKVNKTNIRTIILMAFIAIICFFGCVNITSLVNFCFKNLTGIATISVVNLDSFSIFSLSIFLLGIMPAICEELVFRELIFRGLLSKIKPIYAVIISSLCFALFHFSIYKIFYQFILGIACATILYIFGSVIYNIIFHFVSNFCVLFFTYTTWSKVFEFTSWGTIEVVLSILFFVVSFFILASTFYISKRKNKNIYNEVEDNSFQSKLDVSKKDVLLFVIVMCILLLLWIFNVFLGV